MVSLVNILLISLVAGKRIESNLQDAVSSHLANQLSSFGSRTGGLSSLFDIASRSSNLQKKFSVGSKILEADFDKFTGFSKLSPEKVNDFYGILDSGFQSKQIDFNRIQAFCSSVQILFSSIQSQLFPLLRKAHLLNNEIKFDFKTWYYNQLNEQSIIKLIKKNQKIAQAKQDLVAKEIKAILAQYYQIKLESLNSISLEMYLRKIKIDALGCYAIDILPIFSSLYKETKKCYEIVPVANVIYLPVKEPSELVLVGYSSDEAIQIVQKNSFFDYFSQRVVSVDFSNQHELSDFYLDIESNFKGCGFCIQESKSLISNAVSNSHRSSGRLNVEKLLSRVGSKFLFDYSSKMNFQESTNITIGKDIKIESNSNFRHESSNNITSGSEKTDSDSNTITATNPEKNHSKSPEPKENDPKVENPDIKPKDTKPEGTNPDAVITDTKPIDTKPEGTNPNVIIPESKNKVAIPQVPNKGTVNSETKPIVTRPQVPNPEAKPIVHLPKETNSEVVDHVVKPEVELPVAKPVLINPESNTTFNPFTPIEPETEKGVINKNIAETEIQKPDATQLGSIDRMPVDTPLTDNKPQNQIPVPPGIKSPHRIPTGPTLVDNISTNPTNDKGKDPIVLNYDALKERKDLNLGWNIDESGNSPPIYVRQRSEFLTPPPPPSKAKPQNLAPIDNNLVSSVITPSRPATVENIADDPYNDNSKKSIILNYDALRERKDLKLGWNIDESGNSPPIYVRQRSEFLTPPSPPSRVKRQTVAPITDNAIPINVKSTVDPFTDSSNIIDLKSTVDPFNNNVGPVDASPNVAPITDIIESIDVKPIVAPITDNNVGPIDVSPSVAPITDSVGPIDVSPSVAPITDSVGPIESTPSVSPITNNVGPIDVTPTILNEVKDVQVSSTTNETGRI